MSGPIDAMSNSGLIPSDTIYGDGNLHHSSANAKPSCNNGWYILYLGCTAWKKEALAATLRFKAVPPCNRDKFPTRKGEQVHGAKADTAGALIVPTIDTAGQLHSLQTFAPAGDQRLFFWGLVKGHYHPIGELTRVLLFCDGYARTGAPIHEYTGKAVAVRLIAGNLEPLALVLFAKYSQLEFIIFGDDDRRSHGNLGVARAMAEAQTILGFLVVPLFPTEIPTPTICTTWRRRAP